MLTYGQIQYFPFDFSDMTYCARVSDEEYKTQTEECTEQALVDLMNSVLDNTQFSLKEKKQRLKQFQKHHPYLHEKYFSNIKQVSSTCVNKG